MGPVDVFCAEQRLRNRVANTVSDAWHNQTREVIGGITVVRIGDKIEITSPRSCDPTAFSCTRAEAEDALCEILGAENADDEEDERDDFEDYENTFEAEDPDCGDDDDDDVDIDDADLDELDADDRNLSENGGA